MSGTGNERALLFGSELAALRAWPGFSNPIHRPALAQLLRFGALAAPTSISAGIQQLLPGHLVSIKAPLTVSLPQPRPWWCFRSLLSECIAQPFTDYCVCLEVLEASLKTSVKQQALSDVPLGSFLLVVLIPPNHCASPGSEQPPVRTFTVGFEDSGFNEAPYARNVADHLGTDHCEIILFGRRCPDFDSPVT